MPSNIHVAKEAGKEITNATILFVESTDQQCQSTSGEFVKGLGREPKKQLCKALDSKQIKGEGNYTVKETTQALHT